MDFRQLEYFRAVIKAGSLSQAARDLNMTQPPLSLAIAKLERELGVSLLERTARGVKPTNAGLYLLKHGAELLGRRDRLVGTLSLMGQGIAGELRIGVEPMVVNEIVADTIAAFLQQAPEARIALTDTGPDTILERLMRGDLDLAFLPFGPTAVMDFAFEVCDWRSIVQIEVKLAVPAARSKEVHPDGRGWGRWILPHRLTSFRGMPEQVRAALAGEEGLDVLEVSTPQTAIPLVSAGLGVAPTTRRIAQNHRGVAVLDGPEWLTPMQATLIWRKSDELTPTMRHWIEVAEETGRIRQQEELSF